jgi:hypothetical protein
METRVSGVFLTIPENKQFSFGAFTDEHTSLGPGRAWREVEGGRSLCTDHPLRLNSKTGSGRFPTLLLGIRAPFYTTHGS